MVAIVGALLLAGTALALPAPGEDLIKRQGSCNAKAALPTTTTKLLPDPFKFWDGKAVQTVEDFKCRQQQLQYALEQTELGDYPGPPDSITATQSGTGLSIALTVGGNTATFSAGIRNAGNAGSPSGAIIAFGGASVPVPAGVATITFGNDAFAAQSGQGSRGQGLFYNLFGRQHTAGALTAWAWGVDRIMDALETLGPEKTGIDPKRVAVTGCSRNGKGAFIAGALVKRIALTIPQESGSGGAACWRISDSEKSKGKNIQHAAQIVGENVWFSSRFNSWTSKITQTAADHEALAALIAPRGLYIPENDIDWLGPVSITGCMKAGQLIYQALGVPENMGLSLVGGHSHCQFPSNQQSEITAFYDAFILKKGTKPAALSRSAATVNVQDWAPWTVPKITGTW